MNLRLPVTVLLLAVCCSGCAVVERVRADRYTRNAAAADRWLSDQTQPPALRMAGTWTSQDWGRATFRQSGRIVEGSLGDYDVRGVVSGRRAYLLLSYADWNYYSVILEEVHPGTLAGNFSRAFPFRKALARPIRLQEVIR